MTIKNLQTNLVQNPDFELDCGTPMNAVPCNWWSEFSSTGSVPTFIYPDIGRTGNGVGITSISPGTGYWAQTISVEPSTAYILSGYVSVQNIIGQGAAVQINWLDSTLNQISKDTAGVVTTETGWVQVQGTFTSPSSAASADIVLALVNSTGTAKFDDISLIGGTVNNYGCSNGQCLQGYGNLPAGCNNACTPTSDNYCCQNGVCTAGCGTLPAGCNNTCTPTSNNNYGCSNGQCLPGYGNLPPGCNNTCTGIPMPCSGVMIGNTCIRTIYLLGASAAVVFLMLRK